MTLEYDSDSSDSSLVVFHVLSSSQPPSLPLVLLDMYFSLYLLIEIALKLKF